MCGYMQIAEEPVHERFMISQLAIRILTWQIVPRPIERLHALQKHVLQTFLRVWKHMQSARTCRRTRRDEVGDEGRRCPAEEPGTAKTAMTNLADQVLKRMIRQQTQVLRMRNLLSKCFPCLLQQTRIQYMIDYEPDPWPDPAFSTCHCRSTRRGNVL